MPSSPDHEPEPRWREPNTDPVPDPSPRRPVEPVLLEGRWARAEPLDVATHEAALWAEASRPEAGPSWDWLPYGPFPDEVAYRTHLERQAASPDPRFFAIVPRATGNAAGVASLMRIEPAMACAEIGGIWFGPSLQDSPAATEGLFLLIDHVMTTLGYRRMEWKCNAANGPSRRAAARLGFRFEGIFLQHLIVKGRNRDTAWFSILDGEWPRLRAAYETWLAPANFDPDGRQRTRLSELTRPAAERLSGHPSQ
jgi:RimJ/RimL family protein N-acetyltransferase